MPPQIKIHKEDMITEAFTMIRKHGLDSLNARSLAKQLGCSTQPLFKHFANMEDLKKQVKSVIDDCYRDFVQKRLDMEDQLFSMSIAYIEFARSERHLFGALFLYPLLNSRTLWEVVNSPWNLETIASCEAQYHLTRPQAEQLYRDVRFYCHGIATQLYAQTITLTKDTIADLVRNAIMRFR